MKKNYFFILFLVVNLSGCDMFIGDKVEVPPAHVGKVLTKNGYQPETITPSKFRLPKCWAYCDRLVLLQTSDTGFKESMTVFMPDDKLELLVEVRGTMTIPTASKVVENLYDRLVAKEIDSVTSMIDAKTVYTTYGQQALRGIVRSEIVKYTIADVLAQREAIANNIHAAIVRKLETTNTPIVVSRFELAEVNPPKVIVEAQEKAKEREIAVQQAEADAQVKLTEAELALEVAKKNRLVEREKAEAIAEQNRIAASSITEGVLEYKRLETAQAIYEAVSKNGNTIIIPADASGFANISGSLIQAKVTGQELARALRK